MIELKPDVAVYYSSLGLSLKILNRGEEAEIAVKKAIELDHSNTDYYQVCFIL